MQDYFRNVENLLYVPKTNSEVLQYLQSTFVGDQTNDINNSNGT